MAPKGKSASKRNANKKNGHSDDSGFTQEINCALIQMINREDSAKFIKNWEKAVDDYLKEFASNNTQLMKIVKSASKKIPPKKRSNLLGYITANRSGQLNKTLKDHVFLPCSVCSRLIRKSGPTPKTTSKKYREGKLSLRPSKVSVRKQIIIPRKTQFNFIVTNEMEIC